MLGISTQICNEIVRTAPTNGILLNFTTENAHGHRGAVIASQIPEVTKNLELKT